LGKAKANDRVDPVIALAMACIACVQHGPAVEPGIIGFYREQLARQAHEETAQTKQPPPSAAPVEDDEDDDSLIQVYERGLAEFKIVGEPPNSPIPRGIIGNPIWYRR
jgi:hypothetical protein